MLKSKICIICIICLLSTVESSKFPDWLVTKVGISSKLRVVHNGQAIQITNGLISRTFSTSPGFATIDYYSYEKKSSLLRLSFTFMKGKLYWKMLKTSALKRS